MLHHNFKILNMDSFVELCDKENIGYVLQDGVRLFKASDIGRILGIKKIRSSLAKFPSDEKILLKLNTKGGEQSTTMLNENGLKRLLCRSRSMKADFVAEKLGINVHSNRYTPKETEAMIFLQKALLGVETKPQFSCGPYRIDLYLPEYKIAIECDEVGHCGSRLSMDEKREKFIMNELGCTFLRFRPDDKDFDLAEVVGQCFKWIFDHK